MSEEKSKVSYISAKNLKIQNIREILDILNGNIRNSDYKMIANIKDAHGNQLKLQVSFITAYGKVTGEFANIEGGSESIDTFIAANTVTSDGKAFYRFVEDMTKNQLSSLTSKENTFVHLQDQGHSILLKNVTVCFAGIAATKTFYPYLSVFIDSIMGFSFSVATDDTKSNL